MGLESAADVVSARRAFATAIAATALNPLTIALWTVSFPAAAPNAAESTIGNGAALLAGVAAGTLLWYSGFSTVVAVGRRFLGPRLLPAVEVATGGGLVLFGGLLGLRAVEDR
jgi:threonine/homoserine/homoserine lactone efflux protein